MKGYLENLKPASPAKSRRWAAIFKVLLAIVLIVYVLSQVTLQQFLAVIRDVSWFWLGVSFLLFFVQTALKGLQYWVLLRREVSYTKVLRIVLIQNALISLVASPAGLLSYFAMFRTGENISIKRSGVVFLMTKVGDVISMLLFLALTSLILGSKVERFDILLALLIFCGWFGLFVFFVAILFRKYVAGYLQWLVQRFNLRKIKVAVIGIEYLQQLTAYTTPQIVRVLLQSMMISILYMFAVVAHFFSRSQVFHIGIDFWASAFITTFMQFISLIPIQVLGGLGVQEFTLLVFYHFFDVSGSKIIAAIVGGRLVSYLFQLFAALLSIFGTKLDSEQPKRNEPK